jgi:hypothetical protein
MKSFGSTTLVVTLNYLLISYNLCLVQTLNVGSEIIYVTDLDKTLLGTTYRSSPPSHVGDHGTELILEPEQLAQTLLHHSWEGQQPEHQHSKSVPVIMSILVIMGLS